MSLFQVMAFKGTLIGFLLLSNAALFALTAPSCPSKLNCQSTQCMMEFLKDCIKNLGDEDQMKVLQIIDQSEKGEDNKQKQTTAVMKEGTPEDQEVVSKTPEKSEEEKKSDDDVFKIEDNPTINGTGTNVSDSAQSINDPNVSSEQQANPKESAAQAKVLQVRADQTDSVQERGNNIKRLDADFKEKKKQKECPQCSGALIKTCETSTASNSVTGKSNVVCSSDPGNALVFSQGSAKTNKVSADFANIMHGCGALINDCGSGTEQNEVVSNDINIVGGNICKSTDRCDKIMQKLLDCVTNCS